MFKKLNKESTDIKSTVKYNHNHLFCKKLPKIG